VIFSRTDFNANTEYRDTVEVPSGCYQLLLEDYDGDGLSWWANNDGAGFFRVRKADVSGTIKSWSGDFGSGILYNFTVGGLLTTESIPNQFELDIYPNPAQDVLHISTQAPQFESGYVVLVSDLSGRVVINTKINGEQDFTLPVHHLSAGTYIINMKHKNGTLNKYFQIVR
jgi:hypothetical protein